MRSTGHQTQWAGQFGVAHEMTRRGYLVTFTMGNAPTADLLCKSPGGKEFSVQVKSLKTKNYFLYQNSLLATNSNLYFVFVLVPDVVQGINPQAPEYFVLNKEQFLRTVKEENIRLKSEEEKRGRPFVPFSPGIIYHTLNKDEFRNAWHNLPT
jgi:hypothetical protein